MTLNIWQRMVAIAMPIVPNAGKGPIPKDRIGLKIKFMIKPIIRAFLFFLVSPCAYKKELMTLAKIKKGAPYARVCI